MNCRVLLALMLIVSFLGAIALHEWSHALVASWLGDDTPQSAGRQTLNLRSHIDPVGLMLALILATLATNIAANVVSPANDFAHLRPKLISFRIGGGMSLPFAKSRRKWRPTLDGGRSFSSASSAPSR